MRKEVLKEQEILELDTPTIIENNEQLKKPQKQLQLVEKRESQMSRSGTNTPKRSPSA